MVLFFYPLDFTFVCPTEIIAFNDAAEKFKAANCEVCHPNAHPWPTPCPPLPKLCPSSLPPQLPPRYAVLSCSALFSPQLIAVSVDSQFSHLAWVNTPRNKGGLGHMEIPMVADVNKQISSDYGVLIEGAGIALRCVAPTTTIF